MRLKDAYGDTSAPPCRENGVPWATRSRLSSARMAIGWGIGVIATDDAKVRAAADPVKKEGDGKSPGGVFALGTAFGYASQPLPGLKVPYLNLTPSIECVDDPGSRRYNRLVDRSEERRVGKECR